MHTPCADRVVSFRPHRILLACSLALGTACASSALPNDTGEATDAQSADASRTDVTSTADTVADTRFDVPADAPAIDAPSLDSTGCPGICADAGADVPGDAATCDLRSIRVIPPGVTFGVGVGCDELYLCMPNSAAVTALRSMFAMFLCGPEGAPSPTTCMAGEYRCLYRSGSMTRITATAADVDVMCRVFALPAPARAGVCITFV